MKRAGYLIGLAAALLLLAPAHAADVIYPKGLHVGLVPLDGDEVPPQRAGVCGVVDVPPRGAACSGRWDRQAEGRTAWARWGKLTEPVRP